MGTKRRLFAVALAATLAAPAGAWAQSRQVSGTITKSSGQPISEAVITLPGGAVSTRSNAQGRYSIDVPSGDIRLTFRAIGYTRKDVAVTAGQSTVDVTLADDIFKMEEVVVTGQTTTLERRSATTATASVAAEEITRAPSQSLEQSLQGKVLGATISMNSGAPGGSGQIQIRGATSILGNGQPLYVIDGILISNDASSSGTNIVTRASGTAVGGSQDQVVNRLADINPNEIESIEVLKSAAATAIYGSRATNGVVVIRTKRGVGGATRVNYTQRLGVASPLRLLGYRSITDEETALNLGIVSGAAAVAQTEAAFANGAATLYDNAANLYGNRKPAHEEVLNISGGSENFQYFASATQRQEEGIALNTSARLQALRLNVDQKFSDRWKLSAGVNVTRNLLKRGIGGNDNTSSSPIYALAYTAPWIDLNQRDDQGNFVVNPYNGGGSGQSNPFQTFALLRADEDVFRQLGNATLTYTAVQSAKNLVSLSLNAGFDHYQQDGIVLAPGELQFQKQADRLGTAAQSNINQLQYNIQAAGNWTYSPSSKLTAVTSFGASYETQNNNTYRFRALGLLPGVDLVAQGTQAGEQAKFLFKDQALFVNEQIQAFDSKLVIAGGLRADRSSANGNPDKFYVFPRASASYRFDRPLSFINEFKFRGSWGRAGNRPNFNSRYVLLASGGIIDGRTAIRAAAAVGNPTIRPETSTEIEGGIDATLFNSKVQLEATIYQKKITDLLLQPTLALSTGLGTLLVNDGELTTKGLEAGATIVPINTGKFQWLTRATFQKNTQTVTDLPSYIAPFAAPNSFGAAFGRNRICNQCKATDIWGNVPLDATGKVLPKGVWVTGDSVLALAGVSRDTIVGDSNPDFQMFFTNQFTYKRLTFTGQIDWRKGGLVADMTQSLYDEGETSRDYDDPSPVSGVGLGEYRYRAWRGGNDVRAYLEDGSFVRIRELALNYDAPNRWAQAIGGKSLRFSVMARNLAIFSDYWSFDPEFNNFGISNLNRFIDLAPYPSAKSFYFSVDVGF